MPQAALSIVYNIPGRPRKPQHEPQPVIEEPIVEPQVEQPITPAPEPVIEQPVVVEQKPEPKTVTKTIRDTLYVHFPWSKSVLNEDFRENRETLQRIIDVTRESAINGNMTIKKIQIVGLASVEGNTAYNERLAHDRALALKQYVQQHIDIPNEKFEIVGGGEAWDWFRKQLVENVDQRPDLKRAIEIIDTAPNVNRATSSSTTKTKNSSRALRENQYRTNNNNNNNKTNNDEKVFRLCFIWCNSIDKHVCIHRLLVFQRCLDRATGRDKSQLQSRHRRGID